MKILSLAFCFLLLAVSVNSIAQSSRTKKEISHPIKNNWWVQISPLTLLEPETIVSASIQYNPIPSLGIVLDGGMYIARQSYDDNGFFPYSGFRLKPQVKYYFDTRKREKLGFYISLQGLIKRTTRNRQDWFSRGSNGGQVVFNQLIDYKERKLVLGGNFITGLEFLLGAKKRWMTEIYLGIGVRNKSFRADNLPADVSIDYELGNDRGAFIDLFQNGVFPTVTAGFKVGYRIK